MNSIYIKYTYIALYWGRGAISFFLFLILKMKCCCLCLWFNHPAASWLNFASSGAQEGLSGRQETRNGDVTPHPHVGVGPPGHLPAPAPGACRWRRRRVLGVGFGSVPDSVVSGPGEGGLCRLLSSCTFSSCCSSMLYQCQEGGVKSLFCPPPK